MKVRTLTVAMVCAIAITSVFAGGEQETNGVPGPTELSLWYHGAGNETERAILHGIIGDFNASQSDWQVVLEEFPQESYNESVAAAALAGDLPDIIDVDGPIMPNWAWAGYMAPLQITEEELSDFLARCDRSVERPSLLRRFMGRRGGDVRPSFRLTAIRYSHPHPRPTVDG